MAGAGLRAGELAKRGGVSRKALRVYEQNKILTPAGRTKSGYRLYDEESFAVLIFVKQAQSLGFRLSEIKDIISLRRSGRSPCPHVKGLVRRKLADVEAMRTGRGAICPHIERIPAVKVRRSNGKQEDVPVPVVRRVP